MQFALPSLTTCALRMGFGDRRMPRATATAGCSAGRPRAAIASGAHRPREKADEGSNVACSNTSSLAMHSTLSSVAQPDRHLDGPTGRLRARRATNRGPREATGRSCRVRMADRSADGPERPLPPFLDGVAASHNGKVMRTRLGDADLARTRELKISASTPLGESKRDCESASARAVARTRRGAKAGASARRS